MPFAPMPAIAKPIIISDKYPPLGLSAVSKALHFLEKTFHSKLSPKCFWSLTMARKPQRYHCQKNSHYLFHLNRHFCLRANDTARNRSRVIFSRACADIFRRWKVNITITRYARAEWHIWLILDTSSPQPDDKQDSGWSVRHIAFDMFAWGLGHSDLWLVHEIGPR